MDFAQPADADGFAEVDVAGDGGGADVEPVGGLRGEFVGVGGFDGVDPACRFLVWQPRMGDWVR